jgi:hypothetical protein
MVRAAAITTRMRRIKTFLPALPWSPSSEQKSDQARDEA